MSIEHFISAKALSHLKKGAKRRQRATRRPHHDLLDELARERGLANWHQLIKHSNRTQRTEAAFNDGLVLAYNIKDASGYGDGDGNFVADDRLYFLCAPDVEKYLLTVWAAEESEMAGKNVPVTAEDRKEARQWATDEYFYFRYIGPDLPASFESAIERALEFGYFHPDYLWLRGAFHST